MNTDDLNRTIFISDNLALLKALDTESIDLVVIDPPFGKRQTFTGTLTPPLTKNEKRIERELMQSWGVVNANTAYDAGLEFPDQTGTTANFTDIWNFHLRIYEDWMKTLQDVCPAAWWLIQSTRYSHGDGTAAYIAFMVERMLEIRRVLKLTGSVYLHCDHEANAYLRQMMDAVFGARHFRNEIVWRRTTGVKGTRGATKTLGAVTDTILFYARSSSHTIDVPRVREETPGMRPFKFQDQCGVYRAVADLYSDAGLHDSPKYTWHGHNPPHGWRVSKANLEKLHEDNRIHYNSAGKPFRKQYQDEWEGIPISNLWVDIPQAAGKERAGYPTQKPQALAKRIIEASSKPGDIVLDCFAGCAYVPVAAELLGRRWIACDMSPRAWTVIRRQFHKQDDLRIITEGESPATGEEKGSKEDQIQPYLRDEDILIRVRGPHDLPIRTTADPSRPMRLATLPEVKYRQRAVEDALTIWNAFVEAFDTQCWYCGEVKAKDRRELQLDHIEPNKRDGTNDDCWNRALACVACNSDKSDKLTPDDTIDKAYREGRIKTPILRDEQKALFEKRRAWAQARWDDIKPKLPARN